MEVTFSTSTSSYGNEITETIFSKDGGVNQIGMNFGDLETGVESPIKYIYLRHDGTEPIYGAGFFIRPVGLDWGGYVPTMPDSMLPYNPNFFRMGGVNPTTELPNSSTLDYEFLRTSAYNNPEMGVRLHMDRTNALIRTDGLGFENKGISISPIILNQKSMDYSKTTTNAKLDGYIYPEPADSSKIGKVGDEAKVGISLKFSEDVIGSGHVQMSLVLKYRYTQ